MVWFALQVYYFMAFTYSLPLQFQDFFPCPLPISIWACINMYKSLLRKNRIPSTALESLKGALSCSNFFSCSRETVSTSAGGCSPPACPNKGTGFKHFVPHHPHTLLPSVEASERGEGPPGQGSAVASAGERPAKLDASEETHPRQTSGWLELCEGATWSPRSPRTLTGRGAGTPTHTHTAPMRATVMLSGGCVVRQWRGSLSCEWKTRPQQQSGRRLWIALGMKRREREAIQSTIPFPHCLPA